MFKAISIIALTIQVLALTIQAVSMIAITGIAIGPTSTGSVANSEVQQSCIFGTCEGADDLTSYDAFSPDGIRRTARWSGEAVVCLTEVCFASSSTICSATSPLVVTSSVRGECYWQVFCYGATGVNAIECSSIDLFITAEPVAGWIFGDGFESGSVERWPKAAGVQVGMILAAPH